MRESVKPTVLIAEDDPDDRLLSKEALDEVHSEIDLRFVQDGEELIEYLCRTGGYTNPSNSPRPALILLDLNMPRKDGREALQEIKANPSLRRIPVVILTTSQSEEDISLSYDLGVSGYITKPSNFINLIKIMETLHQYWFELVSSPTR